MKLYPEPTGRFYSTPLTLLTNLMGPTAKARNRRKEGKKERKGKDTEKAGREKNGEKRKGKWSKGEEKKGKKKIITRIGGKKLGRPENEAVNGDHRNELERETAKQPNPLHSHSLRRAYTRPIVA